MRDTTEVGDNYGSALDGGDFNGDGIGDLAIGVPGETVVDSGDGAVSVLFGGAGGQQAVGPDDLLISQSTSDIADDPDFFDGYGAVLSGADFNDDGFADVVVGIPKENLGTAIDAGAANVVFGGSSGPQGTSPDDQFLIQDSTSVKDEVEALDIFGGALAAG
ncbi:MAG TPA: FG-GAP repeat protein [Actinomycetota bacterium]|nr:FG-GAP repeat protein [Actinomycetota bacterium]